MDASESAVQSTKALVKPWGSRGAKGGQQKSFTPFPGTDLPQFITTLSRWQGQPMGGVWPGHIPRSGWIYKRSSRGRQSVKTLLVPYCGQTGREDGETSIEPLKH